MDFDSFKYSMDDVGISVGHAFSLLHGVRFDDDQAAGFVRKGSGTDQPALLLQAFQMFQVGGSMVRAFALPFGSVPSKDHVRHSRAFFGQGLPPFVSVVDFMPPFDGFFTEPPAEIHHSSFHQVRKVA